MEVRIVRGRPDDVEIAALVAALGVVTAAPAPVTPPAHPAGPAWWAPRPPAGFTVSGSWSPLAQTTVT